jgi:enoyl-CoA hydratase/carnithine racemase
MLAQTLRIGEQLSFLDALTVESFAYSALLGGQDFRGWCARRSVRSHQRTDGACLRIERVGDRIIIVLSRSETHNAIDAAMRDELTESLNAVLDDPSVEALELRAEGRAFSVGGALGEFGGLSDTAMGHAIRTLRSPARLLHQLAPRATAFVHGACIGSGIEIAAAAGRIVASRNAWFQLPEISMGLIPGAGGTVTVPRRIGRHRALYWALTGKRLNARDAQSWGLVDVIAEP